MLVLTRRNEEAIVINPGQPNEIIVRLLDARNGRAAIGIDAPRDVKIIRPEIEKRKHG